MRVDQGAGISLRAAPPHIGRVIGVDEVSVRVGPAALPILDRLTLAITAGPPTMLLGPNGAGKTTLLRLMMGLDAPSQGQIEIAPDAGGLPRRLAFVFQKPVMLRRSAAGNIAVALAAVGRPAAAPDVARLLDAVGLADLGARPARRLSGGEQQRLALARALARAPDLLFLDEPTSSLDPAQTKAVEEIIARTASSGVKIVMATHDLGQARRLGGEVVFLAGGRLIEQSPVPQFFATPRTPEARRFLAGDLVL